MHFPTLLLQSQQFIYFRSSDIGFSEMKIVWAQSHLAPQGPARWGRSAGRVTVLSARPWGLTGALPLILKPRFLLGKIKTYYFRLQSALGDEQAHCLELCWLFLSSSQRTASDQQWLPPRWAHLTPWLSA